MATEPPKRKRRWLRYSLKTFLVLVTLFCVLMAWLGTFVYRVNKQREAVQWVRDWGGKVYYDFEWDIEGSRITGSQPPGPDWLRELIGIDYFADVVIVEFYSEVKDLEPLRNLTELLWLYLSDTQVSDLEPLRELTQLQSLSLDGTQVSDLSPLVKMKNVTIYLYEGQQVTIPEELKDRVVRW